ncbi:MAG: UMP kinase [archaeon]
MKIVISLGGSLITDGFSAEKINGYREAIKAIHKTTDKLVIVVGGGKIAREYIDLIKDIGMDRNAQDNIAITLTHANAKIISLALNHKTPGLANETIPRTEQEITQQLQNLDRSKILVCGGTIPGQSTDSVAAKIARDIHADLLINASDIDGVYDRDPKKNIAAKKYNTLTYDRLREIISNNEQSPGKYALFDKSAADIIRQHKIRTIIINATDPEELIKAIGKTHTGTTIE